MALSPGALVLYMAPIFLSIATTPTMAKVELINNGFEGVVVAISPTINESQAMEMNLLEAIKQAMKDGSQTLFESTQQRVFFRKVDILIPYSWNITQFETAVSYGYREGHIRVENRNPIYQDQPYTQQVKLECGAPGEFIHFTPDYLSDEDQVKAWGNRGKNIATEWAKFRWGIFDELGYANDPVYPLFYQVHSIVEGVSSSTYEPNFCANKHVKGKTIDRTTLNIPCKYGHYGKPDANCRFQPDLEDNQEVESSILNYLPLRNNISLFCDNDEHHHNIAAPTKQNAFCNRQSTWSVIMQHQDFTGNRNPQIEKAEQVQFQIVKQVSDVNFVLVLDYSASMTNEQRIQKLQATSQSWIRNDVGDGNSVAIVRFSNKAGTYQLAPLTKITSSNRESLANVIDLKATGGTCIGCGIREALKILQGKINCVILVLTDGEENESPTIQEVNGEVKASGCRAVSVAFGDEASQDLELLALNTDGYTFYANDNDVGIQLDDAFTAVLDYEPEQDPLSINIKISESRPKYVTMTEYTEEFVVDKGLGRNLELRLLTDDLDHITTPPILIGPDGDEVTPTAKDEHKKMWIVQAKTVKSGKWSYKVGLSGNSKHFISSTVTCQPEAEGEYPITASSWTSAPPDGVDLNKHPMVIFAEVKQGTNPVMGADVRALITLPDEANATDPIEIKLLDSGSDPDTLQGDGIYSRYLTGVTITGRIIVKAEVKQGNNSIINKGSSTSKRKKRDLIASESEISPDRCCGSFVPLGRIIGEPTGNFSRSEVTGSVKITGVPDPGSDKIPPSKIRDLTVKNTERDDANISVYYSTFEWTAPGDDLDSGIVNDYSLFFTDNITNIYKEDFSLIRDYEISSEMIDDILQEAGTKVSLNISLELSTFLEGVPYFFALIAEDEKGNKSPVSNIVWVILNPPPTEQPMVAPCHGRSTRIVGGHGAAKGDIPYMVSVHYYTLLGGISHLCSGSIVNDNHILTSASCVEGISASNLRASAGDIHLHIQEDFQEDKNVNAIFFHPDYDNTTKANNIALLRVSHNFVPVHGVIEPALLPEVDDDTELPSGTPLTVAGWGYDEYEGYQRQLLWINDGMTYVPSEECSTNVFGDALTSNCACVVGPEGSGICDMDEGGPVIDETNGMLAGVISWNVGCDAYPGVITRTVKYTQWIRDHFDS